MTSLVFEIVMVYLISGIFLKVRDVFEFFILCNLNFKKVFIKLLDS